MTITIISHTQDVNISGGQIDITEPAGVSIGDLLLTFLENYGSPPAAIPANITGFTSVQAVNDSGTVDSQRTTHRVVDGTEGPTYTSTLGFSTYSRGTMLRITGASTSNPIHNSGTDTASAGTAIFPDVAATVDCLAVVCVTSDEPKSTNPAGWTQYTSPTESLFFYKDVLAGASSGAATFDFVSTADHAITVVLIAKATITTVPDAPTSVLGTTGDTSAYLTWTAGADGGSAIINYDVDWALAATPTTWLGPVSTGSIATNYSKLGLTNGTGYVFRVRAVNANGNGAWSTSSSTVTPQLSAPVKLQYIPIQSAVRLA